MTFITAKSTNDRYRTGAGLIYPVKGYLRYGAIYSAALQNGWYYIDNLGGYARQDVVREVPDPSIPRPAALPIYISQWSTEANSRQSDCGPTCVAMHLRARGDLTPVNQLRTVSPTGLTDAPELRNILAAHNVIGVIDRADPKLPLDQAAKPYSLLLINYGYLPRTLVQDVNFTGWHWLVFVGIDAIDHTQVIVLDPDYWGSRINDGNMKRYPIASLRAAFRPYPGNSTTTSLYLPDLQGGVITVPAPVYVSKFVNSPFPAGINVHSGPAITTPIVGSGFANGDSVSVEMESLSGGYVRERRSGWIAIQYLKDTPPIKEPPPAPPPVRKWKLGFHVTPSDNIPAFELQFKRLHNANRLAMLTIVNDIGLANRMVAYGIPYVVHRSVNDGKEVHEWLAGNASDLTKGANCYNSPANHLSELDPRVIIQMYGCNEQNRPIYGQPDGYFYLGAMQAADREGKGRKLVIFNDSVGNPDISVVNGRVVSTAWRDRKASGVMAYAYAHKHFVGSHVYGAPECNPGSAIYPDGHRNDDNWFWYANRWHAGYSLMAANEKPMVLGTEAGLYCAGYQNREFLLNDLAGYQMRYGGDPLVGAIAYWSLGEKYGWDFSDFSRDLGAVADYFVSHTP